jgi:ABC-type Mn2+/Zn2+ transport system ATPase subunit
MKALSIKNLTKTYANGNQALKGINFSVEAGDFYALLGPNGAGKTTAIGVKYFRSAQPRTFLAPKRFRPTKISKS